MIAAATSEISSPDPWTLTASEPEDGLLYLANGYMSTALAWDGGALYESEACPCYVRGVYNDSASGGIDRLAVVPCWSRLRYGSPARLVGYRRELDLRHGLVRTFLTLEEERGVVDIEQTILVSRADRHLAAVSLMVRPCFEGEITVLAGLDAIPKGDVETLEQGEEHGNLWLRSRVRRYGIEVAISLSLEAMGWQITGAAGEAGATARLRASSSSGGQLYMTQMVRLATSLESTQSMASVRSEVTSWKEARADHERAWDELWQTDVEIEGDPEVQQFARAGLFYLWSSIWPGDHWSIAPMGLSSNGYNGHIFWDAELWMYPTLLVTQPEMAYSCVAYRRHTLEAARHRAAANGFGGAQFPWEGAFTGDEMTPFWATTRDFQLHITADVAIGQWWYYLNTGDMSWLRSYGYPVIRACAEFWVSRAEHNVSLDRYEISDVVCADEYAEHVNNDAFTNAAVRKALLIACRAAELVGEPPPAAWQELADKIYVPYDAVSRRHLEFDGYDGRTTKQADVELLAYPLEHVSDRDQIARDLDYCATVIDPEGPAMSFSVYSILSAQLGRASQAYDYLKRSYVPNARPPFQSFSETPSNNEFFFCTGVGGALQALLFGFTGLRLREGYFVLSPIIPDGWRALRLHGLYLTGARTDIDVSRECVSVCRHLETGSLSVEIERTSGMLTFDWDAALSPHLSCTLETAGGEVRTMPASMPPEAVGLPPGWEQSLRVRVTNEKTLALLDVQIRFQ